MTLRSLTVGALSGVAVFAWSATAWVALPWPDRDPAPLPDGGQLLERLGEDLPDGGLYALPAPLGPSGSGPAEKRAQRLERLRRGPVVSLLVWHPDGRDPTAVGPYLRALGLHALGGILVGLLLARCAHAGFGGRVGFVTLFGLAVSVLGPGAIGNYWGFPAGHVFSQMAVGISGWVLAGVILARWGVPRGVSQRTPSVEGPASGG